jgi:hypothetical protein
LKDGIYFKPQNLKFKKRSREMKNSTLALTTALILGTVGISFAGNRPSVTYPAGMLASASDTVQMDEVTPWHKGALHYATGITTVGAWYRTCPVMTGVLLNSKHEFEATLSNGKRIMLSYAGLKDTVEADIQKYQPYMY